MFIPRWWRLFPTKQNLYAENENVKQQPYFTDPRNWTYLYDHSPLAKTLDKYINYKKLNLAADSRRSARGSSPHNNRSKCYDISTAYIRQHQDGNQSKAYSRLAQDIQFTDFHGLRLKREFMDGMVVYLAIHL